MNLKENEMKKLIFINFLMFLYLIKNYLMVRKYKDNFTYSNIYFLLHFQVYFDY